MHLQFTQVSTVLHVHVHVNNSPYRNVDLRDATSNLNIRVLQFYHTEVCQVHLQAICASLASAM